MNRFSSLLAFVMMAFCSSFALVASAEPVADFVSVPGKISVADIELSDGVKAENSDTNIGYFLAVDRYIKINVDLPSDGNYIITFDTSSKETECVATVSATNGELYVNGTQNANLVAPVTNEWGAYTIHHNIFLKNCSKGHATVTLTNVSGGCNFKNFYCHTSDENGIYYAPASGDINIYDLVMGDKLRNENDGEYMDYFNEENSYFEINLSIPKDGNYSLTFLASNKSKAGSAAVSSTNGAVYVDGKANENTLSLPVTGSWTTFEERLIVLYGCTAGKLTLRLTNVSGESNFKNFHCESYQLNVSYNANNGIGSMENQTIGTMGKLSANGFSYDGYSFAGWNTQADGSGSAFADEEEIIVTGSTKGSLSLYAQWKKSETPSALTNVSSGSFSKPVKTIQNGKVVIFRNGEKFDVMGRKIE